MSNQSTGYPPYMRVIQAILWPIVVAAFLSAVGGQLFIYNESFDFLTANNGVILGAIGLVSLIVGSRWYSYAELGIRGGRPLFAGFGFAFLGWIGFLIARLISVEIDPDFVRGGLGITYLFLLIFEAICVQLWTFGLLFRALNERYSPLAAAIFSGVAFGFAAFLLFQESYPTRLSILYFVLWGLFYSIIRLRTGSWIGIALAQSLQTLTAWHLLPPTDVISLGYLYGISGFIYIIVAWRLFPKSEDDFRV
jgi:hypothetical protein